MATTYTDAAISMTNGTNTVVVRPRTLTKNVYLESAVGDSAQGSTLSSALSTFNTTLTNLNVENGITSVANAITVKGGTVGSEPTFNDLSDAISYLPAKTTISSFKMRSAENGPWTQLTIPSSNQISAIADALGMNIYYTSGTTSAILYLEDSISTSSLTSLNSNLTITTSSSSIVLTSPTGDSITITDSILYYIKTGAFCIFTHNTYGTEYVFYYLIGNDGYYYKNYNFGNYLSYTDTANAIEKYKTYSTLISGGIYTPSGNSIIISTLQNVGVSGYKEIPADAYLSNQYYAHVLDTNVGDFLVVGQFVGQETFIPVTSISNTYLPVLFKIDDIEISESYLSNFNLTDDTTINSLSKESI